MSAVDQCVRCGADLLPAGTHGACTACIRRPQHVYIPQLTPLAPLASRQGKANEASPSDKELELQRQLGIANDEIADLKNQIRQLRVKVIEADIVRAQRAPSRATPRVHHGQSRVLRPRIPYADDDNR